MNKSLQDAMLSAEKKYKDTLWHQGNFTVCILATPKGRIVSVGVTKVNPNLDEKNPAIGDKIAYARAVKALQNGK